MTILYEPGEPRVRQLEPLLGPETAVVYAAPVLARRLTADPSEALVVFGPSVGLAEATAFAREYRALRPRLGVVLLRDRLDDETVAEALGAGIREVLHSGDRERIAGLGAPAPTVAPAAPQAVAPAAPPAALPAAPQAVAPAAPQVSDEADSGAGGARVIAVFSGKGGAGKSVIATNIAVALADGGQSRVCLIDLDLALGDIGILLQLAPDRTISDAIDIAERLDQTGLRTLLTPYRPNLDVLLAPVAPATAERIDRGLVDTVLALARSSFDYVVVDCASQFSEPVLAALDAAHFHVLVTTPELPALKGLRVTLDMFDLLDYRREGRVIVLNRAESRVGVSTPDAEKVLRTAITAHVPSSREVPVSVNRGVPIVADRPQHPVSVALRELAVRHIAGGRPERGRGLRRLVGRRGEPKGKG